MFANELMVLVKNNESRIKGISGYDNKVNFIEEMVLDYNAKNQIARIKLAARASLEASMKFVFLEKESEIIIAALKLHQTRNSFTYKENGFTPEMLNNCREAVDFIRTIICNE